MRPNRTENLSNKFADQSFFRALPPECIAAISLAFGNMADAVVMGQKNGADGLAAVSLSLPVFMIINMFMHGLGLGGSVHFSKLLGSGHYDKARKSFSQILQFTVLLGIFLAIMGNIFLGPLMRLLGTGPEDGLIYTQSSIYVRTIVSGIPIFFVSYLLNYYLRNDDHQRLAAIGFTLGNALDFVLNLVFVLGLGLGVRGAAWATIIGQTVSICIHLPAVFGKRSNNLRYRPQPIRIKEVLQCFRIGLSTSISYVYQMVFLVITNNILMRESGAPGVAVFDMVQNVSFLVRYLYEGVAKTTQPLISTFSGERNRTGIKRIRRISLISANLIGLAFTLGLFFFSRAICAVFGLRGEELISFGSEALQMYCLSLMFAGTSVLLCTYYQAQEEEKNAMFLVTLRSAAVLLPFTVLFSFLDFKYFWLLFVTVEIVSLIIFYVWNIISRKKKKVVDEPTLTRVISTEDGEDLSNLTEDLGRFCTEYGASEKQTDYVTTAVRELCLSVRERAAAKSRKGIIQVTIVSCKDGSFDLFLRDNARRFNIFSFLISDGGIENAVPDSRKMELVQKKAKEFFYRSYCGFNNMYIKI